MNGDILISRPQSNLSATRNSLVEAYEAKHYAVCPSDPVEAITFRMDQLGMTRKDLDAMLGGRGRVSEILTKKRSRSLEMIEVYTEGVEIGRGRWQPFG